MMLLSKSMKNPNTIKLLIINTQSIVAKEKTLKLTVEETNPDVLITTETWLNPSIKPAEFLPKGFLKNPPARKDRPNGHGGVLIAVKDNIICEEVEVNSNPEVEITAMKIPLSVSVKLHKYLLIIAVYCPPNRDSETTLNIIQCHDV